MGKRISNRTFVVDTNIFKTFLMNSFKPFRGGAKRIANVHYVTNSKTAHVQRPINKLNPVECNNNETEIGQ